MYCDHVSLGPYFMLCRAAYSWLYSVLLEGRDETSDHRGHRRTIVFSQPCDLDRHVFERDSQVFLWRVCHLEKLAVGKGVDAIETGRMARLARILYAMPLLLHVGQTNIPAEIRTRTMLINRELVRRCVDWVSVCIRAKRNGMEGNTEEDVEHPLASDTAWPIRAMETVTEAYRTEAPERRCWYLTGISMFTMY
jgi:hypothetical protein